MTQQTKTSISDKKIKIKQEQTYTVLHSSIALVMTGVFSSFHLVWSGCLHAAPSLSPVYFPNRSIISQLFFFFFGN